MTECHPPADWFEFWVRFVCGALLGVLFWFSTFSPPSLTGWQGYPALGGSALLFGLLAGWFGDRFWAVILRLWSWW